MFCTLVEFLPEEVWTIVHYAVVVVAKLQLGDAVCGNLVKIFKLS
jgi:hypothetical protein